MRGTGPFVTTLALVLLAVYAWPAAVLLAVLVAGTLWMERRARR